MVIGKPGYRIPSGEAYDHVFGYTVINHLTARDRQVVGADGHFDMKLAPEKNFNGATRIARGVGEDRLQSANPGELVFDVPAIIEYLSSLLTLRPGTVIATGTPGGTGWGNDPELGGTGVVSPGCLPGRHLRVGDEVRSEVDGIGMIRFRIEAPSVDGAGV